MKGTGSREPVAPLVAAAPEAPPKESRKKLQRRLRELTDEYRDLFMEAQAGVSPAVARRHEIAREMRALSELLYLREADIEVTVTKSATGHPYRIGEKAFPPGRYVVKASVAQTLLYLMDRNKRQELALMQQNGFDIDLGTIGQRARTATLSREDD